MGNQYSDVEEEKDFRWSLVAERNGIHCEQCGSPIPRQEKDIYFERRLCGWCAYQREKGNS